MGRTILATRIPNWLLQILNEIYSILLIIELCHSHIKSNVLDTLYHCGLSRYVKENKYRIYKSTITCADIFQSWSIWLFNLVYIYVLSKNGFEDLWKWKALKITPPGLKKCLTFDAI